MVRVDTLLLAKYGILQPVRREGPLTMTIMHPIAELDREERLDVMEFAQMMIAEHEADYPALQEAMSLENGKVDGDVDVDSVYGNGDDEDEGVLHDEA